MPNTNTYYAEIVSKLTTKSWNIGIEATGYNLTNQVMESNNKGSLQMY